MFKHVRLQHSKSQGSHSRAILMRLFRTIGLLNCVLFISACSIQSIWEHPFSNKTEKKRPFVLLMVGDSITFDSGDDNPHAWLHRLRQNLGPNFVVHNYGINGATALKNSNKPYWQQPEMSVALNTKADAVFIMLGTNDSKTDNWQNGNNFYQADYLNFIAQFAGQANRPKIFIGKNLPAFSDGWTINGDVIEQQILPTVERIARLTKSQLIDFNSPFVGHPELMSDGIHPNHAGGDILVQKMTTTIEQYCQTSSCERFE